MQNLKIKVNSEAESKEAQELFFQLGGKWGFGGCNIQYTDHHHLYLDGGLILVGFSDAAFRMDASKEITLPELRAMVNPTKEWLNTKTYEYKQAACMFGHSEWLEIPGGAEIAIKFKDDPDDFGVLFYKNNGKSYFSKSDKAWQDDADWSMEDLLNENHCEDGIDLSHDILWQRPAQPEALPFIDDNPQSLNDQYAEIEQVRKHKHYFKDVSVLNEIDVYMVLKLFNVTDPCLQHIAKKALCAGQRGHKDFKKDLQDILDTAKRAVEINNE